MNLCAVCSPGEKVNTDASTEMIMQTRVYVHEQIICKLLKRHYRTPVIIYLIKTSFHCDSSTAARRRRRRQTFVVLLVNHPLWSPSGYRKMRLFDGHFCYGHCAIDVIVHLMKTEIKLQMMVIFSKCVYIRWGTDALSNSQLFYANSVIKLILQYAVFPKTT